MVWQRIAAVTWQMFDHLNDGVLIATPAGDVRYINDALLHHFSMAQNGHEWQHVDHLLPTTVNWANLAAAPATQQLLLPDGRFLQLRSATLFHEGETLIQLIVNRSFPNANDAINITIEQLTALTQASKEPDFNKKLQLLVDGLQMVGWNRVLLTLRDADFNATKLITAGFTKNEQKQLRRNMIPGKTWLQYFQDESFQQFKHNNCYFIPGDSEWLQQNMQVMPDETATAGDSKNWHPQDILCAPLLDRDQNKIGLLGVDQPINGRRPSKRSLQIIELYAQFAGSVIESAQLVDKAIAHSRDMEILFAANNAISGMLDLATLTSRIGEYMMTAVSAEEYTFYRWRRGQSQLEVVQDYVTDPKATPLPADTPFQLGDAIQVAQVLTNKQPLIVHIIGDDPNLLRTPTWVHGDEHYISILLPIAFATETYGIIELFRRSDKTHVNERELHLLQALANQMATALETTLLFEDTFEREQFYNALGNISMALNLTMDRDTMLQLVLQEAQRIFDASGAYLWQLTNGDLVGMQALGPGSQNFRDTAVAINNESSLVATIARRAEAIYFPEFSIDDQLSLHLADETAVTSVMGLPLEHEGNLIAVLILTSTGKTRFSATDLSRGTIFGVQVANALQNARLFTELQTLNADLDRRVEERTRALNEESNRVKILLRITSELSASLDEDRVLAQALSLVNEVVHAEEGVILLIDPENDEFIFRADFGTDRTLPPQGERSGLYRHEGLAGWVVEKRTAVIVNDTKTDSRWVDRETSANHRSALGVPLITSDEVIGVLMMFHSSPDTFTMQQLDLVEAAAIQVASAINNANLYRFIRDQANRLGSMLRAEQIETAKSQAILESIADGVLVADDQSNIILANNPITAILDMPRAALVGKSVQELLGLYGQSGDLWISTIEQWAAHPEALQPGVTLADSFEIEDKVLSVHLSPVMAGHQFFGTVSIFRDITKEVEVDRLKTEFVSTVSHELRTPMTSIKGYADLMLMGAAGQLTSPQLKYMEVIKNNANRLHMLVNDLLDISRIETGKTELELRPLDMSQLVEQIVSGHLNGRLQHEAKQLTIHTHVEPSLPLVNADHQRVTQIVTNLVDNAINYTPDGGEIHITLSAKNGNLVTSVRDTGIGITKENLEKIFDRFYRAEDEFVQKVSGTGLGLAIVRSLIEMHDGTISVESSPGAGSTFKFNLPIVSDDIDAD